MPGLRYDRIQHDRLSGHTGPVQCLDLGDGVSLLSGSSDGTVRIWDPERSSQAVQWFSLNGDSYQCINSVIGLNDHDILLGADKHLYWADRRRLDQTPRLIYSAQDDINQISVLDGNLVAWVDDAGLLYMADIIASDLDLRMDPIQAHDNICTSVVIRPESNSTSEIVYTAGMDCKIASWDIDGVEGAPIQTNASASSSVNGNGLIEYSMVHSISCSDDGGLIAAGLHTCDVLLADTHTLTIGRLHAHTSIVSNVHFTAFRPSDTLLSASSDATMVIWNLDPSADLEHTRAHGDFTNAERSLFDMALIQSRIRLPYKPNCIVSDRHGRVYVADISSQIDIYHIL